MGTNTSGLQRGQLVRQRRAQLIAPVRDAASKPEGASKLLDVLAEHGDDPALAKAPLDWLLQQVPWVGPIEAERLMQQAGEWAPPLLKSWADCTERQRSIVREVLVSLALPSP